MSKFGVSRLDQCLREGQNFLRITAQDNARSDYDGVSYAPNASTYSTQYINVDNSTPKIGISGDASKVADANGLTSACFVGGVTIEPSNRQWKNYTISGSLKSTDPFGADLPDCSAKCSTLTGTLLTCATSAAKGNSPYSSPGVLKPNASWTSPSGIDAITGKFTGWTCDSLGPIPDTTTCDWGCSNGTTYDPASGNCVTSSSLFILFDSGTTQAAGPFAARFADRSVLIGKPVTCPTPANADSSTKYTQFQFNGTANYTGLLPLFGPYKIAENGTTLCSPDCWNNYTAAIDANGGTCTATTRNASCDFTAVTSAPGTYYWNTNYVTQTWAGTSKTIGSWTPAVPAPTHNGAPGPCHYECLSPYSWSGATSKCEPPYVAPPLTGSGLPNCTAGAGTAAYPLWGQVSCVVSVRTLMSGTCDTPDITLPNGQVWQACNVGATTAYTGVTLPNLSQCPPLFSIMDIGIDSDCLLPFRNSIGGYFQWGRNDNVAPQ